MNTKSIREAAEDQAMAWVCARDKSGLEAWLEASPDHLVAFLRAEMVWRETARLRSVSAGFARGEAPPRGAIEHSHFFRQREEQTQPRRTRIRRYAFSSAAAVATLALGLVGYRAGMFSEGVTHATAVGGLSTVPTADGSVLTLNTATELVVDMDDHARVVDLKRGEAFFAVAADAARPFVVKVGAQRVVVVGTQFAVRREGDMFRVSVTEGRVQVLRRGWFGGARASRLLDAGQVAEVDADGITVSRQDAETLEQALRWRDGYVVFDGTPLHAAVAQMNRYNVRQVRVHDPAIADIPVDGSFRTQNLDGFLRLLRHGFGIEAMSDRDGGIVLRKTASSL